MYFNQIRILTIFLFVFILHSILFPLSTQASSRGISVISDLSHKSGKLGAYRALIIGINDYKDPKIPDLKTAVNDARTMAKLLRKCYGFKVNLLLNRNATKEAIYRALRRLASSTQPDDSVLIYYAGHGDLDRTYDDGWWIPADAKGGNPITYLDNGQVQKSMRSMKARHVLLISDSCYSGTLFGQARAMPQVINDNYYLNLYNEKSRWGMTSGSKTPVSDTGSGGHSVFAYQLIKELRKNKKPYISTQEIYTRIAPIVGNNSEQVPICRPIRSTGDQGGEFVFVASTGRAVSVKKPISVKAAPAQLPPEGGVSFDDIQKAAEAQRQAKEKWMGWQQARKKEYRSIRAIDESKNLTSQQKTVAWQRFLAAVSHDNPYSSQDDEMRSYSRSRLNYWKSPKPQVTKPDTPAGFSDSETKEAERDGTFIAYTTGVVYDKKTELEWYVGPDKNTSWNEAKKWVASLNVAGGGWRMPKSKEIKTLYKKGAGEVGRSNAGGLFSVLIVPTGKANITSLLKNTGWYVQSSDKVGWSSAWAFNFNECSSVQLTRDTAYLGTRGFAVRSRK